MARKELTWQKAITKVLTEEGAPLHYKDITERIVAQELRTKLGTIPSNTVHAVLSTKECFEKVGVGSFRLKRTIEQFNGGKDSIEDPERPIMALGMFWERDLVMWKANSKILGVEQDGAKAVDMAKQSGIYLLHDIRDIVYVGRTTKNNLGSRLSAHTRDRLKTRWNRFSWFGFRTVKESGSLGSSSKTYGLEDVISAMESLLIEAVEPPLNRKGGDGFQGIEFIQADDPEINRQKEVAIRQLLK